MLKFGTNNIGKVYLGSNLIGKAYLGSNPVYEAGGTPGPQPEPLPSGLSRIDYFDTNGSNYILSPVTFSSGNTYKIEEDLLFLTPVANKGTGWNAGGALVCYSMGNGRFDYGNGANRLSPYISTTNRIIATIEIASGSTTVSALLSGVTSTSTRTNSSLATYAGSTGYPIGSMTKSGGTPYDGVAMRLWYAKIWKNDVLEFDAIPVITTTSFVNEQGVTVSSGTVGLYDKVTEKLYTNRGSNTDFTPAN